jgi:signal transduction histidine kinase
MVQGCRNRCPNRSRSNSCWRARQCWSNRRGAHAAASCAGLRIDVSDNGPGVPEELLPHIFTPFFTTRKGGIGLALVRQLVHANGGTVRHVRLASGGARFVLGF